MLFYLLSTLFSAMANCFAIFFAEQGLLPGITRQDTVNVLLHLNILNLITFFAIYFVQKSRNQIHFSLKKTFSEKDELKQALLFALPVFSASYKMFLAGYIDMSHIAISSMIKPLIVGLLAVVLLRERINKKAIKFAILALFGFYISNLNQMGFVSNEILYLGSYVLIASFGDITRRFYCRKRSEDMQALCVECVMFAFYSVFLLTISGKFSIPLLFHPLVMLLSVFTFLHHYFLVHGVRQASSVIALEFVNLSKPVFTMVFSAILLQDYPNIYNIIGAVIIALSIVGFNAIERQTKKMEETVKTENKSFY